MPECRTNRSLSGRVPAVYFPILFKSTNKCGGIAPNFGSDCTSTNSGASVVLDAPHQVLQAPEATYARPRLQLLPPRMKGP
jgi:hypothetical protein